MSSFNQPQTAGQIDYVVAVRGASLGFSVLLIGILLSTVLRATAPTLGLAGTFTVYLLAFVLSARNTGFAGIPALHGAVAATASYMLILPLVLRDPAGRDAAQIALTLSLAVAVGGLTGSIARARLR